MTSNINIISADITIFDDLTSFVMSFWRSGDIFLRCDAIFGPSCQHFGNAEIHIYM